MNDAIQPDERGGETMSDDDRRLAALLASVQAEPNPAVWARVRTRLAAAGAPAASPSRMDAFLDWLTRPAALAAATATLVVALGTGWSMIDSITATGTSPGTASEQLVASEATSLMESLLESSEAGTGAGSAGSVESNEAGDSAAPNDSGGRS